MSRPKLPRLSWRQARIAAAASLATLLSTALLVQPADADPPEPSPRPAVAALDQKLNAAHTEAGDTLTVQAAAQAAAHREAAAKAHKARLEREARQRAAAAAQAARDKARARQAAQTRADRSGPRTTAAPTATVAGARAWARARLSSAQYQCLSAVVTRESGWNPRATNPSSGAYGLFQALPASKMASAGSDWRTNALTQMRWGLSYMQSRYGSPCGAWNFWQKNHWY